MGANNLSLTSTTGDLNVDSNTLVVDASADTVGIGTSTPDEKLVVSVGTGHVMTKINTGNEANNSGIELSVGNIDKTAIIAEGQGTWKQSDLHFVLNSVDDNSAYTLGTDTRMIIQHTGEVGIGTTTPGSELDVQGTLRLSGSTSGYVGFAPAAAAGSTTYRRTGRPMMC